MSTSDIGVQERAHDDQQTLVFQNKELNDSQPDSLGQLGDLSTVVHFMDSDTSVDEAHLRKNLENQFDLALEMTTGKIIDEDEKRFKKREGIG